VPGGQPGESVPVALTARKPGGRVHGTAAAPRDSVLLAQWKVHASVIGTTVRKGSHRAILDEEKKNANSFDVINEKSSSSNNESFTCLRFPFTCSRFQNVQFDAFFACATLAANSKSWPQKRPASDFYFCHLQLGTNKVANVTCHFRNFNSIANSLWGRK